MPAGNQTLQGYAPTVFTTQSPTAYKANLDSNSSIVGNPAALFYVYPTSPASMVVNIDIGFTYLKLGVGIALNNGGAPATVTLVAPGSNSYYATVYYNTATNTFGAVYSASSVSPAPILADSLSQTSLAFVLITSTTTSIQATNITDCRGGILSPAVYSVSTGTLAVSTAYNVFGASKVVWNGAMSASITLTFNNLRLGADLRVFVNNGTGGALVLKLAATEPDGTAYTIQAINLNAYFDMVLTGLTLPPTTAHSFIFEPLPGPAMQGFVS